MGLQHERLEGDEYYEMLDEFMAAVYNRYPNVFLQFEDFSSDKAMDILNRYRDDYLCFNDDVQGTGAVSVAGLMSALRLQGKPVDALKDQRILIAGAGSAGIGVATALADAMVLQGLSREDVRMSLFLSYPTPSRRSLTYITKYKIKIVLCAILRL